MTGAATVRKCRTVAKTVPLRRYYQMGCLPVRTPVEFGPLAIGVPRDSLSMICMCLFFAFSGAKDASMGFRAFRIECASEWQFWALSSMPSNRPVQSTRKGILRVGSPSLMRVCEFLNPGIFWGCPRGAGMRFPCGQNAFLRAWTFAREIHEISTKSTKYPRATNRANPRKCSLS